LLHYELVEKRIADLRSRIPSGGLREAIVRSLLYAGMDRAAVDERGFEALRRIRRSQSDVPLSVFKATVREQFDMLSIDSESAVAAIPAMLPPDAATKQKAFDLICEVLGARGSHSSEPHSVGTTETVIVLTGSLRMIIDDQTFDLATGDSIFFNADVRHVYESRSSHPTRLLNVIGYSRT